MEIIIKTATINDLPAIRDLNRLLFERESQLFDDTIDLQWTNAEENKNYFSKRILEDDNCIFVAWANDKIIGYLAGGLSQASSYRIPMKLAELENMLVLEEYRGQNAGSMLCQAFADWSKSKGVNRLRVVASAGNSKGINFYRKNGFFDHELILEKNI
ncbi:MAG: GNAT family N-acetyltransferase [Candidatus Buchananbacteria bacterium]